MGLKITKSTEVIETKRITMCLYAVPGIGKTSTASTAEKPLLLDFDRGSHRVRNRGDVVQIEKWEDVLSIGADDLAPYKTVIVDTAGRALDILTPSIIRADAKMGRGGALTLQGFGRLKTEFTAWLKMIHGFGLDVILISHSDEKQTGDELVERLDMQGSSRNEIYKSADVMGRLYMRNAKRMLNFSPADTSFGKNPANLPPIEVPDFVAEPHFLAGVIAKIKASLNEMSAAQVAAAAMQVEWKTKIDGAVSADDFNALIEPVKGADELVRDTAKLLLAKAAKEKGLVWSREKARYEAGATAPKDEAKPSSGGSPAATAAESTSSSSPPAANAAGTESTSSEKPHQGEDKGDAPSAAEMAKGQSELPVAKKGAKGKAA